MGRESPPGGPASDPAPPRPQWPRGSRGWWGWGPRWPPSSSPSSSPWSTPSGAERPATGGPPLSLSPPLPCRTTGPPRESLPTPPRASEEAGRAGPGGGVLGLRTDGASHNLTDFPPDYSPENEEASRRRVYPAPIAAASIHPCDRPPVPPSTHVAFYCSVTQPLAHLATHPRTHLRGSLPVGAPAVLRLRTVGAPVAHGGGAGGGAPARVLTCPSLSTPCVQWEQQSVGVWEVLGESQEAGSAGSPY